jgi:hypothetical protein
MTPGGTDFLDQTVRRSQKLLRLHAAQSPPHDEKGGGRLVRRGDLDRGGGRRRRVASSKALPGTRPPDEHGPGPRVRGGFRGTPWLSGARLGVIITPARKMVTHKPLAPAKNLRWR